MHTYHITYFADIMEYLGKQTNKKHVIQKCAEVIFWIFCVKLLQNNIRSRTFPPNNINIINNNRMGIYNGVGYHRDVSLL
jgi:hypothetical protein